MRQNKKARRNARNVRQASQITTVDAAQFTTHHCFCGAEFLPAESFVITEKPITTVTRVCVDCADTFSNGSFAEQIERANLLLRRTAETEVA